jgi:hypothetical protein
MQIKETSQREEGKDYFMGTVGIIVFLAFLVIYPLMFQDDKNTSSECRLNSDNHIDMDNLS